MLDAMGSIVPAHGVHHEGEDPMAYHNQLCAEILPDVHVTSALAMTSEELEAEIEKHVGGKQMH